MFLLGKFSMLHFVLQRWHSENIFIQNNIHETQFTATIKNVCQECLRGDILAHTVNPSTRRRRQVELCKYEASLVYIGTSRTARAVTWWDPVSRMNEWMNVVREYVIFSSFPTLKITPHWVLFQAAFFPKTTLLQMQNTEWPLSPPASTIALDLLRKL